MLGPARAKQLVILCERVAVAEALAHSLVDYLAPPSQTLAKARQIADQVLAKPAAAVRMSKESINAVATALDHAASYEAHDQLALSAASAEAREARQAALRSKG